MELMLNVALFAAFLLMVSVGSSSRMVSGSEPTPRLHHLVHVLTIPMEQVRKCLYLT